MTDEDKFKKRIGSQNLGPTGLNQAQNEVFRHYSEFKSYIFLEIAYNDSLRQCLTPNKKNFGPKRAKIGPEIRFFCHSLKFGVLVFL